MERIGLQPEMIRSELAEIVGEPNISTDDTDRLVYSTDWFWLPQMWLDRGESPRKPDYIVRPGSVEDIAAILKIANMYKIPVIPWGGGSGSQGGALSIYGGIILDMKRLNRIIEIDEKSLTVTAQAGINGEQLEWAVNEKGLMLPHYPASANCATLGGYLAPRGTGTISTKYGKAEDLVLRMQVVLPDGAHSTYAHCPPTCCRSGFLPDVPGSRGHTGCDFRSYDAVGLHPRSQTASGPFCLMNCPRRLKLDGRS